MLLLYRQIHTPPSPPDPAPSHTAPPQAHEKDTQIDTPPSPTHPAPPHAAPPQAHAKKNPHPNGVIRDFLRKTFQKKAPDRPWYTKPLKALAEQYAKDGDPERDLKAENELRKASEQSRQKSEEATLKAKQNPGPILKESEKAVKLANHLRMGNAAEKMAERLFRKHAHPDILRVHEEHFRSNYGEFSAAYHHV
ncbi:hypothetical protein DACRYDRAFT_108834 [Dacryopinax primogenitus]|uniref:Uncharacterized protein n=1 Tax=Dacryopinax primogenitus (strain DJM 731) TaxID=1858805 RepID=M5FY86_DACPD|nr:uncharacterized protein DACRYDRAFT_108834 [Dacryopinax primogenitus]EJU00775.1 hypothetical protein DACRYDRAFT_108834 [Dacryopinax primogenitus]